MVRWAKAGTVENRFEGDRVALALKEASIPFVTQSFLDTAYDGLYIPQKGWEAIMVPEERMEEAGKIISEIKRHFEEGEDETGQPGGDSEVCHQKGG
jgi:hypothetical protein